MRTRRPERTNRQKRQGLSLVVVMIVLSTAVVVAMAFLHSQAAALRVVENGRAADLAAQAAQTGLAAALDAMQSPTWGGVGLELTAEVGSDGLGYSSYRVNFERVAGDGTEAGATAAALKVRVRSKGRWQAYGAARDTQRDAYLVASLSPRLPGRPVRTGDVSAANDRSPDVAEWADSSAYALHAANGSNSFTAAPLTHVGGDVWLDEDLDVLPGLSCSSSQLADLLTGLGTDYGAMNPHPAPHPLTGTVVHYRALDSTANDALGRLDVARTAATRDVNRPLFDPARYRKYRLFTGGFEYDAVSIGSSVQNVSLGPTDSNPLGIFYSNGNLSVRDGVVIRGTLAASGSITFDGRGIAITPVDWRDGTGKPLVVDRALWPVLPAAVASSSILFTSTSRVFTEGAVLSAQDVVASTPDFAEESALLNYTGTATARPIGGGMSEVRIADLLSLLGLTINSNHAVQLNGPTGRWYPIVAANTLTGVFQVRGTADFPSPVACKFWPRRMHHVDLAGPLVANRVQFGTPSSWSGLSSSWWSARHSAWTDKKNGILGILLGRPNLTFSQSLMEDGLRFDPTVRVTRPGNVNYACEPPLFRPDPAARASGGGYRWEVHAWREVAP